MASTEYQLPALPLGGTDITILRWLKRPAEDFQAGDPLLIALNDRAELALPAPYAGAIEHVLVPEGATTTVGAPIAMLAPAAPSAPVPIAPAGAPAAATPRVTPLARRVAAECGVDLSQLLGTGPSGRVTKADVLAATARVSQLASAAVPILPAAPLAAFQLPADTYALTVMAADLSQATATCARLAPDFARRGLALDPAICVMQAAVAALLLHPQLNSWCDDESMIMPRRVHLAYRWLGRAGVVADAQDRNLRGIARALAGSPVGPDATFTVAAGEEPGWFAQPLPGRRHTGALAVGAAHQRVVIRGVGAAEQIVVRPIALLTLVYDARLIDQPRADAFLRDVVERVEHYRE